MIRRALAVGVMVAATVAAMPASAAPAQVSDLSITVSPSTGLQPGQPVQVTVDGAADSEVNIYSAGRHGFDDIDGHGSVLARVDPGPRPVTVTVTPLPWVESFTTGAWHYCGDCNITAIADFGDGGIAIAPIHIEPGPLGFTFQWDELYGNGPDRPPDGLASGDQLRVAVRGERATETGVALCHSSVVGTHDVYGGPCTPAQPIPAGDAPVQEPLVVSSTFTGSDGTAVACGTTGCVVALASPDGSAFLSRPVSFRPLPLTAEPSGALDDGQVVALTGRGIPATYDGPPFWFFPVTGHWTLGQCEVAVAAQPSIYQVFNHCTNVPGRGEIAVTSTGEVDLGTAPVQASITTILGRQVDCTAAPGTCALSLVRLESGGAVTVFNAPLAFG